MAVSVSKYNFSGHLFMISESEIKTIPLNSLRGEVGESRLLISVHVSCLLSCFGNYVNTFVSTNFEIFVWYQ